MSCAGRGEDEQVEALARRRRDAGFSIIEIAATIAVMAIIMAPLMTAVIATIRASSADRSIAQVETVLQNAADRVNRAPKKCDYTIYAQAAAQSVGWPAGQATVEQKRYIPGANPTVAGQWVNGACENQIPPDLLVQLVKITVTSPDGRATRTFQVVKSDI